MAASFISYFTLFSLFFVWWGANNCFAVDAARIFNRFDYPYLFVTLGMIQLTLGMCISYLQIRVNKRKQRNSIQPNTDNSELSGFVLTVTRTFVIAGICNVIGTVLTNASYKLLGSTSTLVWKLSEPLSVVVLKQFVLKQTTSLCSLAGVFHLLLGVLIFSWRRGNPLSMSPILISNFAYPARNVLIKLEQNNEKVKRSALETFFVLQVMSMPFMTLSFLISIFFHGLSTEPLPFLFRNAIIFNIYQFASMALLQRMDPLSHAIGNTLKRFSGVLISIALTGEVMAMSHVKGLLLALIGFTLYVIGGKSFSDKPRIACKVKYICAFGSLAILAYSFSLRVPEPTPFWNLKLTNPEDNTYNSTYIVIE